MTGFLDFIKKSAQQTEDFVGATKDLAINASADAGLGALGLAGRGVSAIGNSPVVENPITQNAFTHAAKQTAEFVLGASQKYVTNPALGAVAKMGVDPTALLPYVQDKTGGLQFSPLAGVERLGSQLPTPVKLALVAGNPFTAAAQAGALGRAAISHPVESLKHPIRTVENSFSLPGATYQQQISQNKNNPEKQAELRQRVTAIQQAPSFTAAFNASMTGDPWNQLALQVLYDPLTYLGGETQLAKVPGLAEAAQTSRLANAAYTGARGVDVTATGLNKALALPITGTLKAGEKLGSIDLPLAGKLLGLSKRGQASEALGEFQAALNELRQRNFDVKAVQTGPDRLSLEFANLGHAKDSVLNEVKQVTPLEWQSSVNKKSNTLTLTAILPNETKPEDIINAVGQRNISLEDALKPAFEGDEIEQDGVWAWDQPHELEVQGQGLNALTGDTRRTAQLTEGKQRKVIFFDAKPDEGGKYHALVQQFSLTPDGTQLTPARPSFNYRVDPKKSFDTAQEALDAAQRRYQTSLNDFYSEKKAVHAKKVNLIVNDIKQSRVVDADAILEKAFPPDVWNEYTGGLSHVTSDFQQHTLRDALNQIQSEVPQPGEQLYSPVSGQEVSGDAIFAARQNVAKDVTQIAGNLGIEPDSPRVNAAIKVLQPFADANTDLFAKPNSLLNTPQLVAGVEDALQSSNGQTLHAALQDLFGAAPKALPTAADIKFPLSNTLKVSTEQLPFVPTETPAIEMVRNQVTNLGNAINAKPEQVEQVMSVLSPVIEANPQHFIVQRLYDNPILRDGIQKAMAAPDAKSAQTILAKTVNDIDGVWSEMGMRVPAFEKYLGWMDKRNITPASRIGETDATKLSDKASLTLQHVKDEMPQTYDVLKNSEKYINKFNTEKLGLLQQADELAQANGALSPDGGLGTLRDARRVIKKYGSKDQLAQFDKFMHTWGFPRGDSAEQAYVNFASDKAMQDLKRLYEIEDKNTFVHNAYQNLFGMYREKALLSVRYHVANALDMTVRSALNGNNPLVAPSVAKLYAEDGFRALPSEVSAIAQRGQAPVEQSSYGVDPLSSGFWGGLKQAAGAGDKTYLGKIPAIGKIAGPVASINRYLSLAMDSAFRESSFYSGYARFKQDQLIPRFTDLMKQNLKPEDVSLLTDLMRESEFRMAPQEIGTQVTKLTRASGSTREEAQQLGKSMAGYWQQGLDEATRYGVDFTNQVFYKFADERNIEQALHLKGWLPFHLWATRNIPYYSETLAQNPWLVRAYLEYRGLSKEQQKQLNLTGSFKGKLSIGDLPSLLVGANNLAWINPTVAVSVFDQTQPHGEDPNANFFEKAVHDLGRVGLSPAPWITGTANILGYTHDAGTQPLFNPISGPIQALTGVNLDTVTDMTQRFLRNNLSGSDFLPHSTYVPGYTPPSGDPYTEYNVDKIIDQMSVQFTGTAGNPLFERAKALPDSLIYKDALKKARADQRFNELYRFFSPVPLTATNPTELAIRGAEAQLPASGHPGLQTAIAAGDIGTAHFNTSFGDLRKTQINAGRSYLDEYGWPRDYNTQFGYAHSGLTDDQMGALFQMLPWFHQYFTWLQMQPQGSDRTVNHFLQTNRNQNPQ